MYLDIKKAHLTPKCEQEVYVELPEEAGVAQDECGKLIHWLYGCRPATQAWEKHYSALLKKNGFAPEIPEDLYALIKKAVSVRKHLDRNRRDKDTKFRLILIESRIHRLARYYRKVRTLPPNWKYESATASALVA